MSKIGIFSMFKREKEVDGPIEAGQTLGLSPLEVIDAYLDNRNLLLRLLRIYNRCPATKVAEQLGITKDELIRIEESDDLIPFQLVPKIANLFDLDLRMLLYFLGHAKTTESTKNVIRDTEFAMAAQYSGPELTEEQKIDIEDLFKMIAAKAKKGRNDDDLI